MFSVASFTGAVELAPSFSPRPHISHAVFDFDGTLSWLRHGWPGIMCALFGEYLPARAEETPAEMQQSLMADILALNGKASSFQMAMCAERVRERGGQVPDPERLLHEYQRRLDAVIHERSESILNGRAQCDDFVVFGARKLLENLRARGLQLIILSGTSEPRVKQEAALLDLATFFGAHIYGGTADLAQSSKSAILGRLLREEKLRGEHLLSFGDGPVEIRLTRQLGGLAVAVASDEEQNGSGKMHPLKRRQLLDAGADVVIPDYADGAALLSLILGE
jgi:phosphoglycolate phosphatase-like HAD superfamily hydrolase